MRKQKNSLLKKLFSKNTLYILSGLLLLTILITWACNYWVIHSTQKQIYGTIDNIPYRKVGLVLGTNEAWHGGENPFFKNRIDAAVALFNGGKIKYIIVSGDNHTANYDEPKDMKNALVKSGVPESKIFLDYAGFRTFDSMVRCREIFSQDSVTVISQEFHNERALFIANYYKMNAIAFNAKDVSGFSLPTASREFFAKFKAVLDLYVLHTEPKFLGPKVNIE